MFFSEVICNLRYAKTLVMKKLLFTLLCLFTYLSVPSQTFEPAPDDKAVVYFVRTVKGGFGSFANTFIFDTKETIGMLSYRNFIRYECDPGEHLFWAIRSNISVVTFTYYKSFVKATLDPGKIYLMEVRIQMEGIDMDPVDPLIDITRLHRIKVVLNNKSSIKANQFMKKRNFGIHKIDKSFAENGMKRYAKFEEKDKVLTLYPHWNITAEDLKLDKKKKRKEIGSYSLGYSTRLPARQEFPVPASAFNNL